MRHAPPTQHRLNLRRLGDCSGACRPRAKNLRSSCSLNILASVSTGPPGGNGTIILMARSGYACANTCVCPANSMRLKQHQRKKQRIPVSCAFDHLRGDRDPRYVICPHPNKQTTALYEFLYPVVAVKYPAIKRYYGSLENDPRAAQAVMHPPNTLSGSPLGARMLSFTLSKAYHAQSTLC